MKSVVYDGRSKGMSARQLAEADLVITSYGYILSHAENAGPLHQIRWNRVIVDEAHFIRNIKTKTAVACHLLKSKHRWALTGTPVQNSESDIQALFKFLRYKPFDNPCKFKKWYKATNASDLKKLLQTILLRRTKCALQEKGLLTFDGYILLEKSIEIITVELTIDERKLYAEIFKLSKSARWNGTTRSILAYLTRLRQVCDHPYLLTLVNIFFFSQRV